VAQIAASPELVQLARASAVLNLAGVSINRFGSHIGAVPQGGGSIFQSFESRNRFKACTKKF